MKLRNNKSGEIIDTLCEYDCTKGLCFGVDHHDGNPTMACYDSLAELNKEWGDMPEEPKERWYINENGSVMKYVPFDPDGEDLSYMKYQNEIGNYFETKEEAELAVRKLKSWKRLKEKGFRFEGWDNTDRSTIHNFSLFVAIEDLESINKDLDLLFCTEENS